MREELRNEDALQERLESLRLRDEKSRADKILNADGNPGVAQQGATVAPTALEEQVVTAPVTETPGQPAQAAKKSPAARAAALDEVAATQAADYTMIDESSADDTKISVMPRAGLSNMNSESAYFNVQGRYSAGVGLNVQASSNVAFEVGYTFNEYGVSAASSNPWINNLRGAMSVYGADPSFNETLAMKQNVVDAGMRLYLLNPGAKVRPFVAGGGAYSKSFVNYDSQYLATLSATNPEQTRDYESDGFLGYLGAGLDLMVSKSVSVGVVGKFYQVLTSRQNRDFNNAAFMTYDPRYPNYYGANFGTPDQADKQIYGGSLARANFYTVNAGVNFSF
jgi:hypothetical protein